ncbi:MAG: V-type ATP synthase subunit D [Sulfolobales archaeon]|nr:V-type ATP synthase subunit D [Sulfolobales archaeon]MDW8082375.1 V-type ATP synthase subunit D [Sulfolobales archaeon]
MSSGDIIKISRPTKIELIRLRRRLILARRLHRILRDRLTLLVQEFYIALRKAFELRSRINEIFSEIYPCYYRTLRIHGYEFLEVVSDSVATDLKVFAGTRNTVGVLVPMLELREVPKSSPLIPIESYKIQVRRRELLELLVLLAEYEKSLVLIGGEIARTRRKVMMLEKVLIPRIVRTIAYLKMKFDEMEREEKVRMMRTKTMLEKTRVF